MCLSGRPRFRRERVRHVVRQRPGAVPGGGRSGRGQKSAPSCARGCAGEADCSGGGHGRPGSRLGVVPLRGARWCRGRIFGVADRPGRVRFGVGRRGGGGLCGVTSRPCAGIEGVDSSEISCHGHGQQSQRRRVSEGNARRANGSYRGMRSRHRGGFLSTATRPVPAVLQRARPERRNRRGNDAHGRGIRRSITLSDLSHEESVFRCRCHGGRGCRDSQITIPGVRSSR
mmetsp:Transcript_31325/g.78498  ORF Transcript_31325/g.78498 Transcript_31325/m.78498 type:complete len:229 (-) Transcript_31325:227-913(-)